MHTFRRICVFCGSKPGLEAIYTDVAVSLGKYLAKNNIELIYGGSQIGLMGNIANAVLKDKGKVTGVIPHFMTKKEVVHHNLSELIIVDTMHERKLKMSELCDAVITLPGGYGTFDELFEMLSWSQLGIHNKPIGLLNVNGYYDDLLQMLNKMTNKGFLKTIDKERLIVSNDIESLFGLFNSLYEK